MKVNMPGIFYNVTHKHCCIGWKFAELLGVGNSGPDAGQILQVSAKIP
jgi:hypothetical protein